jgi:uncharacterized protein YajQ (UPF0234 family)
MPSMDVVSEVDKAELTNAVDQAKREIDNRYDFKGTNTKIELEETAIKVATNSSAKLDAAFEVINLKLAKRGIPLANMEMGKVEGSGTTVRQAATLLEGLDKDRAKKIVKAIKDAKIKVQAAIQGESVRVTGKKRDDLQAVKALLKEGDFGVAIQFNNFRD